MDTVPLSFTELELQFNLKVKCDDSFGFTFSDKVGITHADSYDGSYEVTPKVDSQILPTADKYMEKDVLINKIPYYSTSNSSGGNTIYIGGNIEYGSI